jgi:hypothetical protein
MPDSVPQIPHVVKLSTKQIVGLQEYVNNVNQLMDDVAKLKGIIEMLVSARNSGSESAVVINGIATFTKLKMGMRYWISGDGLIQENDIIIKQVNNLLFFDADTIFQKITVHFY